MIAQAGSSHAIVAPLWRGRFKLRVGRIHRNGTRIAGPRRPHSRCVPAHL